MSLIVGERVSLMILAPPSADANKSGGALWGWGGDEGFGLRGRGVGVLTQRALRTQRGKGDFFLPGAPPLLRNSVILKGLESSLVKQCDFAGVRGDCEIWMIKPGVPPGVFGQT